jgi:hypothetical protein
MDELRDSRIVRGRDRRSKTGGERETEKKKNENNKKRQKKKRIASYAVQYNYTLSAAQAQNELWADCGAERIPIDLNIAT